MITTVIPTYRRPKLLKRAIFSALNQTMPQIQVCVYDNASGDETRAVVEAIAKSDPRVKYYCHPEQVSAAQNFQFGMNAVDTPFFSVLADDDLLAPDFYKTALASLEQFSQAEFFLGSTLDVSETGQIVSAQALHWKENELYTAPIGLYQAINHYFNWTGAIFRSGLIQKVKLDGSVKPIDFDFILRLSAQFPFVISHKTCAFFIQHKTSYSSNSGAKLVWPSWNKLVQNIEAIESLTLSQKKHAKELMQLRLKKSLFHIAVHNTENRQFDQAKATLEICLNEFPNHRKAKALLYALLYIERHATMDRLFKMALRLYRSRKIATIESLHQDLHPSLVMGAMK